LDDVSRFKEQFKRLAERLHPGEYSEYGYARRVFDFAAGRVQVNTFGHQVHTALAKGKETGNFSKALKVLGERPGVLVKNLDFIMRNSEDHTKVVAAIKDGADSVSGRNLLGVYQHLQNRTREGGSRIFVNRAGKGFSTENTLPRFTKTSLKPVQTALFSALKTRIPVVDNLVVDWDSIKGVALPLSEKTKAEGFEVLPRGSVMDLASFKGGSSLRFFVYWHQHAQRTDYDLSVQFYDKDFNNTGQVSWTNLRYGGGNGDIVHSGDITDATNGATEFIDIKLDKVGSEVAYIVPSINFYAGEAFKDTKECFFGYMERPAEKGKPFEARTVKTKFAVRGEGGAAVPMVFARGEQGWYGKWMDLYLKGRDLGNRVEANKFSTLGLMKAIVEKDYLGVTELVELYADKAVKTTKADKLPDQPVTYIGLRRPEGLHPESKVYTLEQFKELIPQ
jgi:stress response protein SCP2